MAAMNNEDEKREPAEKKDPGAAKETFDLNDISLDTQDTDDIPEKDGPGALTDEVVEQPVDTAEPEDSEPAEETGETALEDHVWEDILAGEPGAAAAEEEPEPLPEAREETPEAIDMSAERFPAEEPVAAAEEKGPEEAPDESDNSRWDDLTFPEEIFAPEEDLLGMVDTAKTFRDGTGQDKEHTAIETNNPVKPEDISSRTPSSSSQPTRGSKLQTVALLLGILAVVCAVAAGLYSQTLKVELENLRQQVETTGPARVAAPAESTTGELARLQTRIEELGARLEEYGHSVQLTEEDRASIQERFDNIEQSINALRMSQKPDVSAPHPTTIAMAPNSVITQPQPAARKGDWIVNLESFTNEKDADRLIDRYISKGIPVEKFSVKIRGKTWHRLRVVGFASAEEAEAYINGTAKQNGFPYAWRERNK
jgi:cell division septation protein DedD